MKRYTHLLSVGVLLATSLTLNAQVKIGGDPNSIDPNSILEIESTNKGVLLPRIPLVAPNNPAPLTSHIAGMQVYNTTSTGDLLPGIYYNDGTKWVRTSESGTGNTTEGPGAPTGTCSNAGELYTDTLSTSPTNGSLWICANNSWVLYNQAPRTPFRLGLGGTVDAGGNKNAYINRQGTILIGPADLTGNPGHADASGNAIQLARWGSPGSVRLDIQSTGSPNVHLTKVTAATGERFMNFYVGSNLVGGISKAAGNNISFVNTSDARLKENIKEAPYSVADLMKIQVREYNYKSDPDKARMTGFLAQQLYEIYPDAVSVGGNDANEEPWQVDYSKLTPLLVKAVQDQQSQIEIQQKRIELQQKEIGDLKYTLNERLAQLERKSGKREVKLTKRSARKKNVESMVFTQ